MLRRLVPSHRSRRSVLLGIVAATTLLPAAAQAAPGPALIAPPHPAIGVFKGGTIRGVVALLWTSGQDGRLDAAFQGVAKTANHRLVASRQPCGTPHDASSGALSWNNIDGGAVTRFWAHRDVIGLLPFIEAQPVLSFRLVRTTVRPGQIACATATRFYDQSQIASPTEYELKNVMVTSFRGFISVTQPFADGFSLNFEEVKGFTGKRRVVASGEPCGTPNTGASTRFSYGYGSTGAGTFRRGLERPVSGDPLGVRSVRLYKGASGFSQPAGCSGIIAILIGL